MDKDGNVYVADTGNNAIRKITPAGVVSTLAGQSGNPGSADGIGSMARFSSPGGVAVDASGNLYVVDSMNHTIRATQSLTSKVDQTITFALLPDKSAADVPFSLAATASSALPVYFNVLAGPAVLDTNNVLTLLGGGTVTIVAWQPGDATYNAATPVQRSFNVNKVPQTITFGALSPQRQGDAPFQLNATASSGLQVNFSASGPATLSGNILLLTGAGTVTVHASQPGNNVYSAAATVDQPLTVLPPNNTVAGQPNTGGFSLSYYGTVGSNYVLQASTNLVNWTNIFTFSCTNNTMNFQDTSATGFTRRFYRAKTQ